MTAKQQQFLYDCMVALPNQYYELIRNAPDKLWDYKKQAVKMYQLSYETVSELAALNANCFTTFLNETKGKQLPDFSSEPLILPDGLETIPIQGFKASKISEVIIPESVRCIGNFAFDDSSLRTVYIQGNHLEEIGRYAFINSGLWEINIPDITEEIRYGAFDNTPFLERMMTGEFTCPDKLIQKNFTFLENKCCIAAVQHKESAVMQEFLNQNFEQTIVETPYFLAELGKTESLKKMIDAVGTKDTIGIIMQNIIDGSENSQNYALRMEIMDYQQRKGLFPDIEKDWEL